MPALAADDSLIGFVLADKYRIVRQIGRGGMGIVYEAEHMQLGKRVAIKLMLEKYMEDGEAVRRFQREAYAASHIGSPHIIDVIDIGTAPDGRSFVVMELLNGLPLTQVLEMTGPMAPWRATAIMRQVLRAVGAAHARGIIHRDLKPDNIFLLEQGDQKDFVKLLDFGISKVMDPDEQIAFTKLTSTGVVMGTPLYMAPEQAMGQPIDKGADIYACGVILYELLAGRPPFEGQTYAVLVAKLLTQLPEYLGNLRPGLPLALVNAVHCALEKDPRHRFPSAEQFAASLPGDRTPSQLELAGTLDSGVAVPRMSLQRPATGNKRTIIAVAAALGLGIATAAVLIATQTGKGSDAKTPAPAPTVTPIKEAVTAQPDPPKPAPAPLSGTVEVETTPSKAHVIVDAVDLGVSSLVATLTPGPHKLRVELAGYAPVEMTVKISANSNTQVMVPLGKATATAAQVPKKPTTTTTVGTKKATVDLTPIIKKDPTRPPSDDSDTPPPTKVNKQPPAQTPPTGAKPNPY